MIHNKIYMSLKNMHFFLNPLIIVHLKKIFLLDQWIAQTVMFMIGRLFATYAMNLGFQFTVEVINENDLLIMRTTSRLPALLTGGWTNGMALKPTVFNAI